MDALKASLGEKEVPKRQGKSSSKKTARGKSPKQSPHQEGCAGRKAKAAKK